MVAKTTYWKTSWFFQFSIGLNESQPEKLQRKILFHVFLNTVKSSLFLIKVNAVKGTIIRSDL